MESQTTEWKEAWRDEYMRTLCAFANMSGGTLEIGRRGIEKIAEARKFWGQAGPFYQIRPNEVKDL